jgi:hypothetical protein
MIDSFTRSNSHPINPIEVFIFWAIKIKNWQFSLIFNNQI